MAERKGAWQARYDKVHCGCFGTGSGLWYRAPQLQVLAMDLYCNPSLAEALLMGAGPRLQHLQLLIVEHEPDWPLWNCFWREIEAFPDLAALQLILAPVYGEDLGEQVSANQEVTEFSADHPISWVACSPWGSGSFPKAVSRCTKQPSCGWPCAGP